MRALNSRETYELMGLLYALAIKGVLKQVEVVLFSSRLPFTRIVNTLVSEISTVWAISDGAQAPSAATNGLSTQFQKRTSCANKDPIIRVCSVWIIKRQRH